MSGVAVRRGVYLLANDRVFDQAVAFLTSFRQHNPTLPLCLVPFADDVDRVAALGDRYAFEVWSDARALRRCDELSRPFHGRVLGHYRKLAMWSGPYDEFVYIDCDTVVLHPVGFVYDLLDRYDFLTSHSDMPDLRRFVWRDSIVETGALNGRQVRYSASTGFVASRRGLLELDRIEADLEPALALAPHMALDCYEQPLLNYLIVTSGRRYSSLFTIAMRTRNRDLPLERWAGSDPGAERERPTLLVHWAGEWERVRREGGQIPQRELWSHYRSMGPP